MVRVPRALLAGLQAPRVSHHEAQRLAHQRDVLLGWRGGGLDAVWPQFAVVTAAGLAFFAYSLVLFRKSIAVTK